MRVTMLPDPPDPGWQPVTLPGWRVAFLGWPLREDGEAGLPDACAKRLASGLGAGALVAFLAAAGPTLATARWTQDGAGTWSISATGSGLFRRRGAPARCRVVASRDPAVIASLFDQPGFDWTQRGQLVFLLPPCDGAPPLTPAEVFDAMADDPPRRPPAACIGLMRPGTDGDFAELATRDADLIAAVAARFVD